MRSVHPVLKLLIEYAILVLLFTAIQATRPSLPYMVAIVALYVVGMTLLREMIRRSTEHRRESTTSSTSNG